MKDLRLGCRSITARRISGMIDPGSPHPLLDMMRTLGLLLCILATGCDEKPIPEPAIDVLRIGVLPDESEDVLIRRYAPLLAYLETETGIPCQLVISETYESLLTDFRDRDVELVLFGGFTFVAAERFSGAVPLVTRLSDLKYSSYYIVRADDPGTSLSDFRGRAWSFGSHLSTSGHLMPRYFLQKQGIEPEAFFGEVQYSDTHVATVYAVRDGTVDIGAVSATIFDNMIRSERISYAEIRILQQTSTYADYVWAAQPHLPETLCNTIRESFLELSRQNEDHRDILDGLDAMGYLPSSVHDYEELTQIMMTTGLLDKLR